MRAHAVAAVGPPFVRYHALGETETDVEVGIPVADPVAGEGPITAGELPGGAVIRTWHIGSHDRLGEAYSRLQLVGRTPASAGRRGGLLVDRPGADPDPANWPPPAEWRRAVQPCVAFTGRDGTGIAMSQPPRDTEDSVMPDELGTRPMTARRLFRVVLADA